MGMSMIKEAVQQVGEYMFLKRAGVLGRILRPGEAMAPSLGHHALEIGALGAIGAGPAARLMGHPLSQGTDDALDVGGLGALIAPEAIGAFKKLRGLKVK